MTQTPLPPSFHMGQGMSEAEQRAKDNNDDAETVVQITVVVNKPVKSVTINQTITREQE